MPRRRLDCSHRFAGCHSQDIPTWLKFSALCRKSGRLALSLKVLTGLMGFDPHKAAKQAGKLAGAVEGKESKVPAVAR